MAAYWLARARIIDADKYRKYNEAARAAWEKYPRKVLARGGRFQVLEGDVQYTRFVIQEFPSFAAALEYHNSSEYQAAAAFRRDAGGVNELVIVEGTSDGIGNSVGDLRDLRNPD